jgi:ribosomal protein S4
VGLADSVSDATRKIKAGAVEINGRKVGLILTEAPAELVVSAGRKWVRITLP